MYFNFVITPPILFRQENCKPGSRKGDLYGSRFNETVPGKDIFLLEIHIFFHYNHTIFVPDRKMYINQQLTDDHFQGTAHGPHCCILSLSVAGYGTIRKIFCRSG